MVAGVLVSAAFLVAAAVSLTFPAGMTRGLWLPLHLALAGAATTAIAAVMPFFAAAFAAAPPADARLRGTSVAAVAVGGAVVAGGVVGVAYDVAVAGAVTFLAGIAGVAAATALPLRGSLGPGRGLVTRAYLVALGQLGVGVLLGSLFLASWEPMAVAWGGGRAAHAWLNLVGFVSLVIATTLLHFFPTVVGARIGGGRSPRVAVYGLAVGPPLVAAGSLSSSDVVVRVGAVVAVTGAAGLTAYAATVWRTRARWTTDLDWHRFAMGALVSAVTWFDVGVLVAAGRAFALGASPAAWSTQLVAAPLVVGWVATAIVASATHLLPAVGPGGPTEHARQRDVLGRFAVPRLVLLNVGTALLAAGGVLEAEAVALEGDAVVLRSEAVVLGPDAVVLAGAIATVVALGSTIALLGRAASLGIRRAAGD